jgi:CHAT domain
MKILFLAVNDRDQSLRLDEEYREIDRSISRQQNRLELVSKQALRLNELQQGLLQHMPDIVHFGGHGSPSGELMLRDEVGALAAVTPDALRSMFAAHRGRVRLVLLSACFSAAQARAVRDSIGIAVGMRRRISDQAAIVFVAAFYEALAYRRTVREAFDLGVAAIKLHGLPEEADTPELLVRPDLNASAVSLGDARASTRRPRRPGLVALQARRMIFMTLLAAAVVLAVLFGSGILRQNIISEYTVLVILGCLAGILTWGILSSSGEISGSRYGITVKLGGSSVTVAVTIAGGLWLATAEHEFAIKIKFIDESRQPVHVTGTLRLEIEAYTIPMPVRSADLVELGQLPRRMAGRVASLTLESTPFRLGSPDQKYRVQPNEMLLVHVRPVSATKISGTVSFEGARMPGGHISLVGRDCAGDVRDGFFEIACEETTLPVKIQIRVPELYTSRICTREVVLKTLTNNEVVLEGCAKLAVRGDGPPPRTCPLRNPEDIIRREADLVREHDLRVVALFTPDAQIIDAQTDQRRSPRDRYQSEFSAHRFAEASHADIRYIRSERGVEFYTSSSAGRFFDGGGYNNPGPSDHWIFEKLGDCWRIKTLIINAAHDRDRRFTAE